ncbi:MAG: farnesyl diphosphate synthase [Gammaproteobacteria bacterium]
MVTRPPNGPLPERMDNYLQRVEKKLKQILATENNAPPLLRDAMSYSVFGAGKRVRPLLSYASGELLGVADYAIDAIAASVELVHAYSLVHDDLPAMDNDDLRRGRAATHRKFDEAIAILTGDALQTLAFSSLSSDYKLRMQPQAQIKIISWLAQAAGPSGMVGGQTLDISAEGQQVDEATLKDIHRRKTGELIRASIMMPTELTKLTAKEKLNLDKFAQNIGLAFQIRDDLLEVEEDTETLGKSTESDTQQSKATYPSTLGAEKARQRANEVYSLAVEALATFGESSAGLSALSAFIVNRTK